MTLTSTLRYTSRTCTLFISMKAHVANLNNNNFLLLLSIKFFMENSRRYIILVCIFFTILIPISNSAQFVSTSQNITDTTQTVDSSSPEKFRFGFFSPGNSSNRYVGIWFNNVPGPTTVWVANRDNPLQDSTGVLKIGKDGNLIIVAGEKNVIWTSNVSSSTVTTNSRAELLDTGNLVLRNGSGGIVWQSFDHPSNVFLPNMTIGVNTKTGHKLVITSWKDEESDPSNGNFTLELDPMGIPQSIIMDGFVNERHWRSGPWNNRNFIGIPTVSSTYLDRFSVLTDNEKGTVYLTLAYSEVRNILQKYTLTSEGNFIETQWNEEKKEWEEKWRAQDTECDVYGKCGPFGSCNILDSPICRCLEGFVPKSIDEWRNGNWLGGCARVAELQCHRSKNETYNPKNVSRTDAGGNEADGFLKYEKMKVPDYVERWETLSAKECRQSCLQNCSCLAYASDRNIGCMWWARDLVDMQKFGDFSGAGIELYVKVASSELGTKKDDRIFIIAGIVIGIVIISLCIFLCWRRKTKQRGI
ncbi:hypothetical protein MKW94_004112 [Papaver nudicaule]|uniref:Uncharacterized protein n=1 Tax=Papaver nudicaule TaxID=74823 RepID=A0AA41RQK3_PAPNU|nr:hypothetical protein [Papaver nudicaule]